MSKYVEIITVLAWTFFVVLVWGTKVGDHCRGGYLK